MTTLKPIGRKLHVELEALELVSAGGIHLPQAALEGPRRRPGGRWGRVLAVGPRCRLGINAGDRVLCNTWVSESVSTGNPTVQGIGVERVIVEETDVFAVEEAEAAE